MSDGLVGTQETICAAARRALPAIPDVANARPLGKGYSNEAWIVEAGADLLVAKIAIRNPDGQRLRNAIAGSELAKDAGIPTTQYIHADFHCAEFEGRPFSLSRFVEGEDAEDALPEMDGPTAEAFFEEWGSVVARMHAVAGPGFGPDLVDAGAISSWSDWTASRIATIPARFLRAGLDEAAAVQETSDRLLRAAAQHAELVQPRLVHSDLYLANVLVADGHFRAQLDFEHAHFGDPAADFVKLELLVFDAIPGSREPFMVGYQRDHNLPDDFQDRVTAAIGLEMLYGVPFFHRWNDQGILAQYRDRWQRWLDETQANWG